MNRSFYTLVFTLMTTCIIIEMSAQQLSLHPGIVVTQIDVGLILLLDDIDGKVCNSSCLLMV